MTTIQDTSAASRKLNIPESALFSIKIRYEELKKQGWTTFSINDSEQTYQDLNNALHLNAQFGPASWDSWTIRGNQADILFFGHEDGPTIHGSKEYAAEIIDTAEKIRQWLEGKLRELLGKPAIVVRLEIKQNTIL